MAKEVKQKGNNLYNKVINVGKSKNGGNTYFYIKTKDNKLVFVTLIKDGKKFVPVLKDGVKQLEVTYTSYERGDKQEEKTNNLTLFNVSEIVQIR
ncbi:MAG: hypothetical protein QXN68_02695 [Thermoplasmata archaeon]